MTKAKRALSVRALSVTDAETLAPSQLRDSDEPAQNPDELPDLTSELQADTEEDGQLHLGDMNTAEAGRTSGEGIVAPDAPAVDVSAELSGELMEPALGKDDDAVAVPPGHEDVANASQADFTDPANPTEVMATAAAEDEAAENDAGITPIAEAPLERLSEILESLLFAAEGLLTVKQLQDVTGEPSPSRITQALEALRRTYETRGVELAVVGGAYGFRTTSRNAVWVQKMLGRKPVRLTRAQLETLSIIAYRQPVTRPELEEIRGVDSGAPLKILLERNLVRVLGKREEAGRPLLYGTTKEFLEFFQLKDLSELPSLREVYELSDVAAAEAAPEEAPPLVAVDLPAFDGTHGESLLQELEAAEAALARATDGVALDVSSSAQGENPGPS